MGLRAYCGLSIAVGAVVLLVGLNWGIMQLVGWPWRLAVFGLEVAAAGWLVGEVFTS